jgi:hypothetical protein
MFRSIKSKPVFLVLLPVFFVLHGFTINYDSVPLRDAGMLVIEYLAISAAFTGFWWLLYRDWIKAAIMAIVVMIVYLFFGSIQDFFKDYLPSFLSRYRFLLPFLLAVFIAFYILIKRQHSFKKISFYLNLLFVVLILVDVSSLIIKIPSVKKLKRFDAAAEGFIPCDSCSKPDIFLIIPDQYSGHSLLQKDFRFDNSIFENELKERGFYIAGHSRSNYNLTPFSVASILDMNYLPAVKKGAQDFGTVNYSYRITRNSRALKFLKRSGYRFYNCSIFDFDGQPAQRYESFLPYGKKLIHSETITGRIAEDLRDDILKGRFGSQLRKKLAYENLNFNDNMMTRTIRIAEEKSPAPKFVYTHLMMPHYPYYFDRKGNQLPLDEVAKFKNDPVAYVEYLQYCNLKLIEMIDLILSASSSPPVIILLSDHGYQAGDGSGDFINLNTVCFPNKNYELFYDSISAVNEFRVVFNACLNQRLPLLKDSTVNVR